MSYYKLQRENVKKEITKHSNKLKGALKSSAISAAITGGALFIANIPFIKDSLEISRQAIESGASANAHSDPLGLIVGVCGGVALLSVIKSGYHLVKLQQEKTKLATVRDTQRGIINHQTEKLKYNETKGLYIETLQPPVVSPKK